MSRKKPSPDEDLFSTIPAQETFDAFPSAAAFPEGDIAFLTGRAPSPEAATATTDRETPTPAATPTEQETSLKARQKARLKTSQPVSRPVSKPVSQPVSHTASRTASPSASQSAGLQASQSTSRTPSPSQGQSKSHTRDLSTSQTPGLTHSLSQGQSPGLSLGVSPVAERLNANQRRVLELLLAAKPYIIRFREVGQAAGLGEASARTIMRRLEALGFLTFRKARDGNLQGVRIAFNQQLVEQYLESRQPGQTASLSQSHTGSQTPSQSINHFANHAAGQTPSRTGDQPDTKPASLQASQSDPLQIDRENTLSIPSMEHWDDPLIELMWPKVHEAGLRLEQLTQAAAARAKLGKGLDPELVRISLDRAQWELEEKGCLSDLATGKEVRSAPAYIFTALARWGTLRAHPDYVSREELEAKAATEEARRRKEAAENLEAKRFEAFVAGLSPEALEEAMRGYPGGSREAWLKFVWRGRRGESDAAPGSVGGEGEGREKVNM